MSDKLFDQVRDITSKNAIAARSLVKSQQKMTDDVTKICDLIKSGKMKKDELESFLTFLHDCLYNHHISLEDASFWAKKLSTKIEEELKKNRG